MLTTRDRLCLLWDMDQLIPAYLDLDFGLQHPLRIPLKLAYFQMHVTDVSKLGTLPGIVPLIYYDMFHLLLILLRTR